MPIIAFQAFYRPDPSMAHARSAAWIILSSVVLQSLASLYHSLLRYTSQDLSATFLKNYDTLLRIFRWSGSRQMPNWATIEHFSHYASIVTAILIQCTNYMMELLSLHAYSLRQDDPQCWDDFRKELNILLDDEVLRHAKLALGNYVNRIRSVHSNQAPVIMRQQKKLKLEHTFSCKDGVLKSSVGLKTLIRAADMGEMLLDLSG